MFGLFRNTEKELEKARIKLESELSIRGVDFLIEQMNSEDIYSPLLEKRRRTETSRTDEVKWYAYRRAEELSTDNEKENLLNLRASHSASPKRKHIYFALAHLCKNRVDNELFDFLMKCLKSESDDICKRVILIGIQKMEKSANLNIEPIKMLAKHKSRDLKVNSILALQKTHDEEVEQLLLDIFKGTKDSHIKNMICTPLQSVGTFKAVPILEEAYKKTRDIGLRHNIELTVNRIKKNQQPTTE
ncbi:HEAT repeat domain-containing protein [Nafulsella turpanensis]|uniref:HEAT repeat domain-containing protein n=1 Tax=Nafulsella turpanensis TaxID=1265690 RepID=UPI00034D4DD4|nr:HEAT repeat domain-containing protein [Nafulsella turpanensis]